MGVHVEEGYTKYSFKNISLDKIRMQNFSGYEYGVDRVAWFLPRKKDISRIIQIAQQISERKLPRILDVGCAHGFLPYLLAETGGAEVIGIDPAEEHIKNSIYSHPNLRLEVGSAQSAARDYSDGSIDLVINSWMPKDLDLTPPIQEIRANGILYIKHPYQTGVDRYNIDTGITEQSYLPGENYQDALYWRGIDGFSVNNIINGDSFLVNFKNEFLLQLRKGTIIPEDIKDFQDSYPWEDGKFQKYLRQNPHKSSKLEEVSQIKYFS